MPNLAASLNMLFFEHPLLERIGAAAAAGFKAVEIQAPYEHPPAAVAAELERHAIEAVLINTPVGDAAAGERGLAAVPGRQADFQAAFDRALLYARALRCRRIHVLAGAVAASPETEETFIGNLRAAGERAAGAGVMLLIEPLNARDAPNYFLHTTGQAVALIDRIGRDNVQLQFDLYHCQISEGDLAEHARRLFGRYGHVQIAGVPERHEPDAGEVNYVYLLDLLDRLGYRGWIGCEYRPAASTLAGLGWAARWGIAATSEAGR